MPHCLINGLPGQKYAFVILMAGIDALLKCTFVHNNFFGKKCCSVNISITVYFANLLRSCMSRCILGKQSVIAIVPCIEHMVSLTCS